MNNISDLILSGLGAALVTAASTILVAYRQTRAPRGRQRRVKNAWEAQAKELIGNVNEIWAQRAAQYERTIAYNELTIAHLQQQLSEARGGGHSSGQG